MALKRSASARRDFLPNSASQMPAQMAGGTAMTAAKSVMQSVPASALPMPPLKPCGAERVVRKSQLSASEPRSRMVARIQSITPTASASARTEKPWTRLS